METKDILYTRQDGIATIKLNRPHARNAFAGDMMAAFAALVDDARLDDEVRVVVITGQGAAFCAGADVKALATGNLQRSTPAQTRNNWRNTTHKIPRALQALDKPCIAAINGYAVGWGMDLASMCDIRFAADTAKVCMGYVRMGVAPGGGGCYFLPRIVGMARALELIWTGRWVDAQEMLEIGYVSKVVPLDELHAVTWQFAQELAKGPPVGIQYAKRLAYRSQDLDLNAALEMNELVKVINWTTEDSIEGPRAFAERRPPDFKGR